MAIEAQAVRTAETQAFEKGLADLDLDMGFGKSLTRQGPASPNAKGRSASPAIPRVVSMMAAFEVSERGVCVPSGSNTAEHLSKMLSGAPEAFEPTVWKLHGKSWFLPCCKGTFDIQNVLWLNLWIAA